MKVVEILMKTALGIHFLQISCSIIREEGRGGGKYERGKER